MSILGKREHTVVDTVFKSSWRVYMLNSFTWAIGMLVDGAIIGNFLGVNPVAAYGLVWPLTLVYALIGNVVSGGARSLYTRYAGQGKLPEANRVYSLALLLAVGLSLAAMLLSYAMLSPLAQLLGASGDHALLRPQVCQYLGGLLLSLPFDNGAKVISCFISIDSDDRHVVIATVAMTVTDIVGDLLVVLVFHGGMFLLGFTTALGQLVYFLILSLHFLRPDRMLHFTLKGLTRVGEKIRLILYHGAPVGISHIASAVCGIVVNRILAASASASYLAAYSVHQSMTSLVGACYMGIADTVWTLSSIFYGEEDEKALDELQRTSLRIGLKVTLIAAALLLTFPRLFASIYIGRSDQEALALGVHAVQFFALSLPLYMLAYLFDNYLMGVGQLHASNLFSFFLECAAVLPVVWILVRLLGGSGAWTATPIFLFIMIVNALVYILFWKDGDSFSQKRLLLKSDFGNATGKELSISADTMLEVVGMSRLAGLFCRENGIDAKKANILALCIEELGANIINHGFSDGKPHSIDMRILAKEDGLILRIRDDCRPFNLMERYRMTVAQDGDPTRNIGIRMVVKMSRDVRYLSTLETNNLIIRI